VDELREVLGKVYECAVGAVGVGHAANLLCLVVARVTSKLKYGSSAARTVLVLNVYND
jgi:hypothetical protein